MRDRNTPWRTFGAAALAVTLLMPLSDAFAAHGGVHSSRAEHTRPPVGFAEFDATVTVQADGFKQYGWFTLGAESDGADPLTQDLGLSVGTFAATIPAGAFRRGPAGAGGRMRYTFEGTIAGTWLDVTLSQIDEKSFEVKVEGRGEAAMEITRPEFVTLSIGENAGSVVPAQVE